MAKATSDRARRTSCPVPFTRRCRSAARSPAAASVPVMASQAGSRWLNGTPRFVGPVAQGKPVAGFTV
jgi:hypothetical protein